VERTTPAAYLTLDGAAAELALSERTIRRAIAAGDLPAYKVGKSVRIRRADLEAWLESKRLPNARSGAPVAARRRLAPAAQAR